ncbi:MAG: GDSL-type esterase/lipase family protein [Ilumatobacteraceae bacterium]
MTRNVAVLVVGAAVAVAAGALVVRARSGENRRRDPIDRGSIVMLGDSITDEGDWSSLLPGHPIVNRGYSGSTSAELVPIAAEVAKARPLAVLILTGTNDIRDTRPAAWTAEHLASIIDHFERHAPETTVVVQTILPRADAPDAVRLANDAIRQVASERHVHVLDLHRSFDDGAGGLRTADTTDGVHLSEAGYRRWASLVEGMLGTLTVPRPANNGRCGGC